MTKKIITSYSTFLIMVLMMTGVAITHASEVTGTLSSDASSNSQTSGKELGGNVGGNANTGGEIEGTVSSEVDTEGNLSGSVVSGSSVSGGGSSSGGGRGGSSGSANEPAGVVLGESIVNTSTPGFPNAGFATDELKTHVTVWSKVVTFIRNIVSF